MLSAVYYPHTVLHPDSKSTQRLLKRSLLMWDQLDFIVPEQGFKAKYSDRTIAKAIELIGNNRVPTDEEKRNAHEQIEELITRPNLPEIFYSAAPEVDGFNIYPDKLLPKTWDLIRSAKFAVRSSNMAPRPPAPPASARARQGGGEVYRDYDDYLINEGQAGLAVASILADCCAGSTRSRVTDRLGAYSKLTSLLADKAQEIEIRDRMVDISLRAAQAEELLISLHLPVLDVDKVELDQLVRFREREATESGHTLRDLRHRYLERVEKQVQRATTEAATGSDVGELERQFSEESKDDIAALRNELHFETKQALLSKEVLVTVIATLGSLAFALFALQFNIPTAYSLSAIPVTAGSLVSARDKFLKARTDTLRKHPMAFLFELTRTDS